MKRSDQEDFFQPVLSTLGLISSVIATLIPLFPIEQVKNLFVEKQFIGVVSSSTFLLGFIIVWMVIELKLGYINMPIGFKKERGNGYLEPWYTLTPTQSISLMIFVDVLLLTAYLALSQFTGFIFGIIQALIYIIFFLILIAAFAIIYSLSKMGHEYNDQKLNFQKTVFDTLERNGHISSALEIKEVYQLNGDDLKRLGVPGFQPLGKLVIVKTVRQEEKELHCILSSDCKEIIKVTNIKNS